MSNNRYLLTRRNNASTSKRFAEMKIDLNFIFTIACDTLQQSHEDFYGIYKIFLRYHK